MEAVELGPQESRGHYYLGLTLLRLGRRQDAIAELERSRDLDGRPNPSVLHELGTAYLQAERLNDAERTLKQAVALAPRLVRLRLQLGWVYYKKVEGEKAAAEFRALLSKLARVPKAELDDQERKYRKERGRTMAMAMKATPKPKREK